MKTNVMYYSLRVWLTSVIMSPILVELYLTWQDNSAPDSELAQLMLVWGSACSIPSLIALCLCCNHLVHRRDTVKAVKLPLTIISVILTYAPFWVLNGFSFADNSTASIIFIPYCLTIVAGIWFYQLKGVSDARLEDAPR